MRHRYLIEKQLLNNDCPYVKIHNYSQAGLIQNLKLEDLKRFYSLQIQSIMSVICFGGYNITKEENQKIKDIILSARWSYKNKVSFPRCQITVNQVKHIQDKGITNGIYLNFIFPLPGNGKINVIQRKAIRILLEDFHNHSFQYSLNAVLRKIGVYRSSLKMYLFQNWGYFYYSLFGNYNQELAITKVFKETMENWKKEDILFPIIRESIQDICSQRQIDYDNEARFYNFNDVLAIGKKPFNDKEYIKSLNALMSIL